MQQIKKIIVAMGMVVLSTACSHREPIEDEAGASTAVADPVSVNEVMRVAGRVNVKGAPARVHQRRLVKTMKSNVLAGKASAERSWTDSVVMQALAHAPQPFQQTGTGPLDRENYLHFAENAVQSVVENPVSTFSVDVDTAAYSNIRRMIMSEGRLPPKDSVKIEEMINYFSYNYEIPESRQQPFSVSVEMAPAPWNVKHQLLQVGLKGFEPAPAQRPVANLVFLVDVSGSMRSADKLGLVKKSLGLLVNQLNKEDHIALVVYAGAAGMILDSTPADQKAKIRLAIDSLQAGGSTNGGAGIERAYRLAEQHFVEGGINRVIIASDGDMNVGVVNHQALKNLIERKRRGGVSLSTLGFGSGNYNYALMEQLADVGDGNAAYIDTLKEAQKVLVEEMQSTLMTIARDVKIQIEFNPVVSATTLGPQSCF